MTTIRPPAADLSGVTARIRALDAALDDRDGLVVFNRVYLSVTEEMTRRVGGGSGEPSALEVLAVLFAERYLAAVAGGGGSATPACWRPLLLRRHDPAVLPLQFALAGINAHVGHDLALAVVDTCASLGCGPTALEADFDLVGEVLVRLETRIREELMPGPDLLDAADPLTHLAASWCLGRARDAAWVASRMLWGLRGAQEVCAEFSERLDSGVAVVSRCLLIPPESRS